MTETDIPAADVVASYDCKTPGCAGEARSRFGRHAYCRACQQARGTRPAQASSGTNGSRGELVVRLDQLKQLAIRADRARAKAVRLTEEALQQKRVADELAAELERELAHAIRRPDEP